VQDGAHIAPLEHVSWGQPLVFIDGQDDAQVAWALKQNAEIVLVQGSPVTLSEKHSKWFYFDQAGVLTKKFGITQVPAIVSQEAQRLKIEEIFLG
jgi:conjugal transfer pilus assembly protein TraW